MSHSPRGSSPATSPGHSIGYLLLLVGLVVNKWSVERIVSADERLDSLWVVIVIGACQVFAIVLGAYLVRRPIVPRSRVVFAGVAGVLVTVVGVGVFGSLKALHIVDPNRDFREAWQTMEASEELIRVLTPEMGQLATSIMNLELPDHRTRQMFGSEVAVVDVEMTAPSLLAGPLRSVALDRGTWSVSARAEERLGAEVDLWRPLMDATAYFDHAKLSIVRGRFLGGEGDRYQTDVAFEALANLASGARRWVKGDLRVDWSRTGRNATPVTEGEAKGPPPPAEVEIAVEEEASQWVITRFETLEMRLTEAERLLFAEVLDDAVSGEALVAARRSIHQERILDLLIDPDGFERPDRFFSLPAFDRHPGLAVVDLDRDGWDDIYVTARWGRNQFFRNRGDGTFEEIAAELGLDLEDHASSAIFADFDNDGDHDVFVGRTLEPSVYLENADGRFIDRSGSMADGTLPYLVSSVSAVDYDGDGLLDVYLSRYAAEMLARLSPDESLEDYLSPEDAAELDEYRAAPDAHRNLNWPGPPNVLLRNEGQGSFAVVRDAPALSVFKNTYQTTWADFDRDGDQDAYIANDFAPNHFVRNDGGGAFVDITAQTATADLGFGMGATWGDYDEDGDQDLYVSNMFSKAGTRITEQLAGLDPRFAGMARGNSLFENGTGDFEKVSGMSAPALLVEKAGWGWGSQFLDVDNDGYLDLYALSGYYTAPPEVELPIDL